MNRKLAFLVSDLFNFLPFCHKLTETGDHDINVFLDYKAQSDLYPSTSMFTAYHEAQAREIFELINRNVKFSSEYPEKDSSEEILLPDFKKIRIKNITYVDFIVESLNDGYEILDIFSWPARTRA